MFTEKDRLIYQCPVFHTYHDPLTVKRALAIAGKGAFNRSAVVYGIKSAEEAERAVAEGVLVACGRAAFGLKPIDPVSGSGVSDAQVIDAVGHFTGWLSGKDEPAQTLRTSAPCTDCPQQN